MEVHESLKTWSLPVSLNRFTHELIGPQINNILLITWDQTMSQEMLKIFIIGPKIFSALAPSLKQGPNYESWEGYHTASFFSFFFSHKTKLNSANALCK
jgi:hypothetical protein